MSDIAISVENISKRYRIGVSGGPSYHRLSEMISGVPRALWNYGRTAFRPSKDDRGEAESANKDEFWALKDVSFEVKQGEVVGIIGRNGAGKSTLLKILSRITEPTSGRVGIRGRVASLLEVGTGFHPELTGRENIYVSGITLGMTRAEIKKCFDEIVDFSGVEKFLDTPVKHYSSGMQVRLGFAVAAHLESEVLIVDEVLAVGDSAFQTLCLTRMQSLANSGRTIIMVSHQLDLLRSLATEVVWLREGQVISCGSPQSTLDAFTQATSETRTHVRYPDDPTSPIRIREVIAASPYRSDGEFEKNETLQITIQYDVNTPVKQAHVACLLNRGSECVFVTSDLDTSMSGYGTRNKGRYSSSFNLPTEILTTGFYSVTVTTGHPNVDVFDRRADAITFEIIDESTPSRELFGNTLPGIVRPICKWSTEWCNFDSDLTAIT